jgi:hypothetical protein
MSINFVEESDLLVVLLSSVNGSEASTSNSRVPTKDTKLSFDGRPEISKDVSKLRQLYPLHAIHHISNSCWSMAQQPV